MHTDVSICICSFVFASEKAAMCPAALVHVGALSRINAFRLSQRREQAEAAKGSLLDPQGTKAFRVSKGDGCWRKHLNVCVYAHC